MFAVGSSANVVVATSGTRIAGGTQVPGPQSYLLLPTPVTATVLVTAELDALAFKMPLLYDQLPECVRQQDIELVDRGNVPLYIWDTVPVWDEDPFTWDEVIGPEPIGKTTMRICQLELEKTCLEISEIARLYDLDRTPKEFLPYHASLLGTPLPGVSEKQQRAFLETLVATYQRKGSPLSFFRLFEQLGFILTLQETYQRKGDAGTVDGPQIALKTNALVVDEPVGTTETGKVTYRLSTLNPITRGTLKIESFDQDVVLPTVIIDDGEGGWSDNVAGFVNYETGIFEFTLPTTPALNGQPIQATYDHRVDAFPHINREKYNDRVRSSVVQFAITPKDSSVVLDAEAINRIELYLSLLKPHHVIIQNLDLILNFQDQEVATDDLNPFSNLFVETVFGTMYNGLAWSSEDNGSLDHTSPGNQHRTGPEFLKDESIDDQTEIAPYTYPWLSNGTFTNPVLAGADFTNTGFGISGVSASQATLDSSVTDLVANLSLGEYIFLDGFATEEDNGLWKLTGAPAGVGPWTAQITKQDDDTIANEAAGASVTLTKHALVRETVWEDVASTEIFEAVITSDSPRTTTSFSISKPGSTSLGEDDHCVLVDGPTGGESRNITSLTDQTTYYDVVVDSAYPVAPEVGDNVTLLDRESTVNLRNLEAGFRPQDPVDLYFGFESSVAPDGILTSFTITITKTPILTNSVSFLRFTIGGTAYEETATGTGAFTNTSGHVSSSSINYGSGAVSVTFGTAPDTSTLVETYSTEAGATTLGTY